MKKIVMLVLVLVMATAFPALAKKGPKGPGGPGGGDDFRLPPGRWWRVPEAVTTLALTSDEQTRLDNLYVQNRRQMIDLKSQVEKEKLELEVLFNTTELDESAVKNRFAKLQTARNQLAQQRFNYILEVRKLLGYERFQQLKAAFQQRKMKHKRPRGMQGRFMNPEPGNPPGNPE